MYKNNIGVAILDTGIYRHMDFEDRIIAFKDFVNGQVIPYDDNGHGSHVPYRKKHRQENTYGRRVFLGQEKYSDKAST